MSLTFVYRSNRWLFPRAMMNHNHPQDVCGREGGEAVAANIVHNLITLIYIYILVNWTPSSPRRRFLFLNWLMDCESYIYIWSCVVQMAFEFHSDGLTRRLLGLAPQNSRIITSPTAGGWTTSHHIHAHTHKCILSALLGTRSEDLVVVMTEWCVFLLLFHF